MANVESYNYSVHGAVREADAMAELPLLDTRSTRTNVSGP